MPSEQSDPATQRSVSAHSEFFVSVPVPATATRILDIAEFRAALALRGIDPTSLTGIEFIAPAAVILLGDRADSMLGVIAADANYYDPIVNMHNMLISGTGSVVMKVFHG